MKRWLIIFTILLSLIAFSAAMAEEPTTPTDLPCPHEHTEVLCYFDNPNYSRIDDENHRVYGSAILDTVCEDCGELLYTDIRRDAEQTRAHSFKNGVCVLCGARQPETSNPDNPEPPVPENTPVPVTGDGSLSSYVDIPGEYTLVPHPENPESPLLVLLLTREDLANLEEQEYKKLIVRPEGGTAAIALPIAALWTEMGESNGNLRVEIEQADNGTVFTALRLAEDDFYPELLLGGEQIEVRFYQTANPPTVLYNPEGSIEQNFTEQSAVSVIPTPPADPYCVIPWIGNGAYSPVTY